MPESYWITLKDPKEFEGITSAVIGLDGVSQIRDQRETRQAALRLARRAEVRARGAIAGFLLVAALLLVANTIRLAAFARRKEIAIMRLVGASTLYIALPFLLEALVTAVDRRGARRRAPSGRSCASASSSGSARLALVHAVDRAGGLHGPRWSSSRSSGRCSPCFRHSY